MKPWIKNLMVDILKERGQELLVADNEEGMKKQLEAERLYYWIFNRLWVEMENANPPQREYSLQIEEKCYDQETGAITFSYYGNPGEKYHTRYVTGNDINDVLLRVKYLFITHQGFTASLVQTHSDKQKVFMTVTLTL